MATPPLEELLRRICDGGMLDDPVVDGGTVRGRTSLDAAGSDVIVSVDPELDDEDDPDLDELIDGLNRALAMNETQWTSMIEAVVADIEDTAGDDDDTDAPEQTDLRDDLEARSLVVFADAVLLRFAAPRTFPDSRILVQLDEDLEVATVEVEND